MNKYEKWFLIIFLVLALVILFYAFVFRPAKVRSFCSGWSAEVLRDYERLRKQHHYPADSIEKINELKNDEYLSCLEKNGIDE